MAGIPDIRAKIAVSVARVINVNVDFAGRGGSAAQSIGDFIGTCAALLPPALAFVICRLAGASVVVTVCGCLGIAGATATLQVATARRRRRRVAGSNRRRGPVRPRTRREILATEERKRKRPGGRSKRASIYKRKLRRDKDRRRPRR